MIYYGISIFAIVGKFRNWTMGIKVEDKIFIKEVGIWTEFWVMLYNVGFKLRHRIL